MAKTEHRDFGQPDELREFPSGHADILNTGVGTIGRLVFEPGWRWSKDLKDVAGTNLCEAPHFQYHIAGTLRIQMADGTEFDATPGQLTYLPAGHDAWVVGDEQVVAIDWYGAAHYAES
jgi:hypothetical protein